MPEVQHESWQVQGLVLDIKADTDYAVYQFNMYMYL